MKINKEQLGLINNIGGIKLIYTNPFNTTQILPFITNTLSNSNSNSNSIPKSYFIDVPLITDTKEIGYTAVTATVTSQINEKIEDEFTAQFPLFFPNITEILIPKKIKVDLERYMDRELLRCVDKDLDIAIEKCLLFLNNLSSTYYTENKWKKLHSVYLHEQTRNSKNDYIYKKIERVLLTGTKKQGPVIEIIKNKIGGDSYLVGVESRKFRITEKYFKAGLTTYNLKNEGIIKQRNKTFYKLLKEANNNVICKNLIDIYSRIDLPTHEEIKKEAKRLIKEKFTTKKGKKLTFRNKHTNAYWNDISERSFVEDNIELFDFLTKRGYMIPTPGDEKSGCRIVDSFTLMPSWIRNLIKIDGKKVFECDYSALHPNIAIKLYSGNTKFITHKKVSEESGVDIKEVKVEHLSFLNKNWREMSYSPLFDYYTKKEPKMMEEIYHDKIENGHKITSKKMFKTEVQIMTEVIEILNKEKIYVGYVYDALFCTESDKARVIEVMNEVVIEFGVYTTAK